MRLGSPVGVVTGVTGSLLRIRWSTGEESSVIPAAGALAVIGKARKPSGKKASEPTKAVKSTRSAPKANKAAKKSTR